MTLQSDLRAIQAQATQVLESWEFDTPVQVETTEEAAVFGLLGLCVGTQRASFGPKIANSPPLPPKMSSRGAMVVGSNHPVS